MDFIDLKSQYALLRDAIGTRIQTVLDNGQYIMGPEVGELERLLANFAGTRHALSCSSGTDALLLALMAWNIKPGDAVFVPAFTFVATAEAVALVGATPVFVDVLPDTFNIDPESLASAVDAIEKAGQLRPACVIPVDLFGQPANYDAIAEIASRHQLLVLADAAQGFGATWHGKPVGSLGTITATSFFPAKPLGGYGDGGAVFTDDDDLADRMRSIRVHGQGADRYDNVRLGINGRLDTIQAAILIEKLKIFPAEIQARQQVADRYNEGLRGCAVTPVLADGATSVWAQYTIQVDRRDDVIAHLKAAKIPVGVYYPRPLHLQPPYVGYPRVPGGLPVCDALALKVLSLPMHPYLDGKSQDEVIAAVRAAVGSGS